MQKIDNIITRVVSYYLSSSKEQNPLFIQYLQFFYSQSINKDFLEYPTKTLLDLALSSFNFFSQKPANNFKIKLYNPSVKNDGFDFDYTIIDIINDDMSFLVDSMVIQLNNQNIEIKNIIHPILTTKRSVDGNIQSFFKEEDQSNESIIQIHVAKIQDEDLNQLKQSLIEILDTIKIVVEDWAGMSNLARKSSNSLRNLKVTDKEIDFLEAADFADWVVDNKFIFLGAIEFDVKNINDQLHYKEVVGSRLGIYKSTYEITKPNIFNVSPEAVAAAVQNPYLVEILKSRYKSYIHRHTNAERIRIQKFDNQGKVTGEYRFIGLFTSAAYYQNPKLIPIVRKKIDKVIVQSGYSKNSSNFKNLLSALESYPRDELFQIEQDDLLRIISGIVAISGRSLVRIFVRNDKFARFVSCLVFIPRDNFNTSLRERIQNFIAEQYNGEATDIFVQTDESNLTRLHLIVRTNNGIPEIDVVQLEKQIIEMCRLWSDDFESEVLKNFSTMAARDILFNYKNSFSVSYTNRFNPQDAVIDIGYINQCITSGKMFCNIYKTTASIEDVVELKIYSPETKLSLSKVMPMLDSFGFNVVQEHTYLISLQKQTNAWVHYFHLKLNDNDNKLNEEIKNNFVETVNKIWSEETKINYLNRLVVASGLSWRQIYLLFAYSKYLHQIGLRYNENYLSDVLVKHHKLTKLFINLFEAKFNPNSSLDRQNAINNISLEIENGLNKISDLTEDNIIRKFFNVIQATTRTNFYQTTSTGEIKPYLSFKLNSNQVIDMPLPVMYAEIFVYAVGFEGIHLRGGKVARGGLRWSDRGDDFRTEVLGLVKAQMTKNAVIVPVGSKGGFFVKKNTKDLSREQILQNGIESYKSFLQGLLDITDNVADGKIINPKDVIKYDDNDPYLVVAADKGTATFSDIANSISAEYHFWLGDAFASGGSVGYDHKKMGITAKGAWVGVERHFAEMKIDIKTQSFTCIGIGDLSGDVFGNGMLLSKHTKLIAAFNHLHIFIDPNPDCSISFAERQRIFNLARSNWTDYSPDKISQGGGVFERSAKIITLSPQARQALAISQESLTPNQLISAIIKAPVDLLWNGGIGTYVKAIDESNMDVGDRINDQLRVNGSELNCKVVGEGGNLGFTQKGRIEAALNGVRINTDAIDNSAGVDCSDHEVNIKIALTAAIKAGKISIEQRNIILEQMTEEVSQLVLSDNKNQTGAISAAYSQGYLALGDQAQFLNNLEHCGSLNRKVEFLPENKEITKRQADKIGMTRPELCVMLAYSKMDLYHKIISSDIPQDHYLQPDLISYFPKLLQKQFPDEIKNHQLRHEIIATQLTNSIVNKAGITFINQIANDTGFSDVKIVRNFIIACDSFGLDEIWVEIDQLGNKLDIEVKSRIIFTINKLLERSVVWLLRHQQISDIANTVAKYKEIINQLFANLDSNLFGISAESFKNKINFYQQAGISAQLSRKIAAMDPLASAFDIAEIATNSSFDINIIAKTYFQIGDRFALKWLRSKALSINVYNYWQKLSLKTILEDLYINQAKLTKKIINFNFENNVNNKDEFILHWLEKQNNLVQRYDNFVTELKGQNNPDLSMFVVALNRIRALN